LDRDRRAASAMHARRARNTFIASVDDDRQ
jgi:hypothetical protein